MNIKVALGFEVLVTERASKSPGIIMNSHVFFEIITFLEAFSAKWAAKRFISSMHSFLVALHLNLLIETFVTGVTFECLFIGVGLLMS